jgi:hypothetical protein
MSIQWSDTTSYSRGERETKKPTTWTTRLGGTADGAHSLTVTSGHVRNPGHWVFHCPMLCYDTVELTDAKTAEQAQMMALERVRKRLEFMLAALISGWLGK